MPPAQASAQGLMWFSRSEDGAASELGDMPVSTCLLDKLLNSCLPSEEEYLFLTFSQLTYFYFGDSVHILFTLFFAQALKKFAEFLQEKKQTSFSLYFHLCCQT